MEFLRKPENHIPIGNPDLVVGIEEKLANILESGWLTSGIWCRELEYSFSTLINRKYAITVSSCTMGIRLLLDILNLGEEDEVLVPDWTFASVANMVMHTKAKLKLVDCDPSSLNLNLQDLANKVSEKTKVLILPSYSGIMMDIEALKKALNNREIFIIEDCAHSPGAQYKEKMSGSFGHAAVFSFYANKIISAGEGGIVVTDNEDIAQKLTLLRLHGMNSSAIDRYKGTGKWRYDIEAFGYKANLTDLQACVAFHQLGHLDKLNDRRRKIAEYYLEQLSSIEELKLFKRKPHDVWWIFPLLILKGSRDMFIQLMAENNIATSVHFIPIHKFASYKNNLNDSMFPIATRTFKDMVSIPLFASMQDEEVEFVADSVKKFMKNIKK